MGLTMNLTDGSGAEVGPLARWCVTVGASVLAFLVVAIPWAVLSKGGDDPWDVIGPVAGVVAAGVLAALGWWASQPGAPGAGPSARRVRQSARGQGNITQTGGNRGSVQGARRRLGRESVRQKARGGGDIDQVGGNRA